MKKGILLLITAIMLLCSFPCNIAYAQEEDNISTAESIKDTTHGLLSADVIETKFKVSNGRLMYRHWNRTRGRWVEDHWMYVQ